MHLYPAGSDLPETSFLCKTSHPPSHPIFCRLGRRFYLGISLFALKANYFLCKAHRVVYFSVRGCVWMVLNGRKQMTQFTKQEEISGVSGLKQSLLLYGAMWKSLCHSLYTTLHLFPRMSFACIRWKSCIFFSHNKLQSQPQSRVHSLKCPSLLS